MNIKYISSSIRFRFEVDGKRTDAICAKSKNAPGTWYVTIQRGGCSMLVTHIGSTINSGAVLHLILKHLTP